MGILHGFMMHLFLEDSILKIGLLNPKKTTRIGTTPPGSEWAKVNLPRKDAKKDEWAIKDLVDVPENLAPGQYVLSFRWDSQRTPQVWNACANIEIV